MQPMAAFRGKKQDFRAYLDGVKSGKVVDLQWYRYKKKAATRAADVINSAPSIA